MTSATRWTTQAWFASVLATMVLLIVAGSVLGASVLADTTAVSNRLSDRISPARTAVVELDAALRDQASGVRAFSLSGRAELLEPYRQGVAAERDAAGRIRSLLAEEQDLLAALDRVERQAAQWQRDTAEPAVDTGADSFAGVREQVTALDALLVEERARGRAALDSSRQVRNAVFIGLAVLLLVAVAAIAVLLRVVVVRPLGRLGAAARTVAAGDFDRPLVPGGPADIAAVGRDVEAMRGRLVEVLVATGEARDALARSNADLEQFAYVASHDLQEPLRKVASFCQMLQRRYADSLDDRAQQYISFAVDGATRMQRLINDLLTFSRIGRVYDGRRPVDLNEIVEQAAALTIEQNGAGIDCPELPTVPGDPTLLMMLWQNLFSNAVKFRHPDRQPHVTVTATSEGELWTFTVRDNGIGIDPQFAEKIFVIFQRLHGREQYTGTGIGLAICKRVVEHHGGTIRLDTSHDGGAGFVFTLPGPDIRPDVPLDEGG
ncbi:ATP-binding protein [Actinoplanes sp. NEAU-A12]|uniref:histidine kinase n=1 Tax=Actinoplanes sandaracinus TaxID=3045177 RepID=A0ABT6WRV5_9ACTN|nr:ATP-binding protein [Actinoplanes sandaracinus]MDI6102365.1 ATP-binding protein [Actinoplanes sandaracinus]